MSIGGSAYSKMIVKREMSDENLHKGTLEEARLTVAECTHEKGILT